MKRIYMIGICGVAMGTLASMLKERGYDVEGSDLNIYPPMSLMLEKWNIKVNEGFSSKNIIDPDLVIIGNAISRGNEEVEYVLNKDIPYISMADALYKFFLEEKEVIAVCGTHGKTTTTAILSHILKQAGEDPSFLIGGVSNNYGSNYYLGKGRYFIIEGDEYDSAYFQKTPKFIQYKPNHIILTSIEFDHADIYNNLNEIKLWFKRLVNIIPSKGNIVYNCDYENVKEVMGKSFSNTISYGFDENSEFRIVFKEFSEEFSHFEILYNYDKIVLKSIQWGNYNYLNFAAAVAMALKLGIDPAKISNAVETFSGVKRRQELIFKNNNIRIYEDFAHHPTAIFETIKMMASRFEDRKIVAVYEPRSATSRRNILQDRLSKAFVLADEVYIKTPYLLDKIDESDRIDIKSVASELEGKGIPVTIFENTGKITDEIIQKYHDTKTIIIIMSNGGFDNIYYKLVSGFKDTCEG